MQDIEFFNNEAVEGMLHSRVPLAILPGGTANVLASEMKLGNRLEWIAENFKLPEYKPDFSSFVLRLPVRAADAAATGHSVAMFQRAVDHPAYDSFWRAISIRERIAEMRVPVFAVGGWYDNYVESDLGAFAALRAASRTSRILVGPWPHNMASPFQGVDFGPDSQISVRALQLAWFDRWLKGKESPLLAGPPV